MKSDRWIRILFVASGIYDGLLGVVFFFAGAWMYAAFNVTPPNHWGYIKFGAEILVIFAAMFFAIAANPRAHRNLIPGGIGLKLAYSLTVFGYWFTQGLPGMWKPFAVIDFACAILFYWAWVALAAPARVTAAAVTG